MQTNRHKLRVIAVMLILVLAVAGCSSGGQSGGSTPAPGTGSGESQAKKEKVTIEAWMLPVVSEEKWQALADRFNAEHEDIQVNMTVLPWTNGREQIKTALGAGNGPDVYYIPVGLDQDYIDAKIMPPVTTLGVTQEELDQYLPLIKTNSVDGEIYALPLAYDIVMLFVNKEILKQHGFDNPPATYDELYNMASAISQATMENGKPAVMGFQFRGMDEHLNFMNHIWETLFKAEGGDYITDGKSSINSPAGQRALSYMKKFYENNVSIPGISAIEGFENETIAMIPYIQTVASDRGWYTKEEFKDKWAMVPMPKGSVSSAGYLGGHSVAVNAKSPKARETAVFMKWLASPEHATLWMERDLVPAHDLEKIDPAIKQQIEQMMASRAATWDSIYKQLNVNIEAGVVELQLQKRLGYTQRWNAVPNQFVAAVTGQISIEEALTQVDRQVDQGLRR
ncbi:MAG: hypothetical protein BAA02_04585 [Paenibacillaceae bacterium ZCTH02-B3]|nr:MAG: hypothetical protein BAA02_04585 [Paenibacillaceae bacterium ZCTH02-B3]